MHRLVPALVSEMTLQASGITAEGNAEGVLINMVPRDGGNQFAGMLSGLYTNKHLAGDNLNSDLIAAMEWAAMPFDVIQRVFAGGDGAVVTGATTATGTWALYNYMYNVKQNRAIRIGALTTYADLIRSPLVSTSSARRRAIWSGFSSFSACSAPSGV